MIHAREKCFIFTGSFGFHASSVNLILSTLGRMVLACG
jgi:hypothetical protein